MASVVLPISATSASGTRQQHDVAIPSESQADKIEVFQRSASMDISYALLQERSKQTAKVTSGSLRSRSSITTAHRRQSSPLARSLSKRATGGEGYGNDHELRALNRRWQENLMQDVDKLRGPIKTTKSRSAGTDQDDDTILVKNSAVNYKPSTQQPEPQKKQKDERVDDNEDDDIKELKPVQPVVENLKLKREMRSSLKNDDTPSTDISTSSTSSTDRYRFITKPPLVTPKRNRFFSLLNRKKAEEEKRFAEIIKPSDQSTSTTSGFFSNKKQAAPVNTNPSKRNKHFSLTPFPTPPRVVRPMSPPTPKMVVMKRTSASDLSTMTTTTLTTTSKTSTVKTSSTAEASHTKSSTNEILRDLSLSSSASTSSSPGPVVTKKAVSPKAGAPTKAQIAAAIANPEKSLKRARRYRKEATRLLNTVTPDTSNVLTGCAPKENPREFKGRAKKAYQYAAEARRIYDILGKADKDSEATRGIQEEMNAPKATKEYSEGTSSTQSCSSEDTHTDSTTFSEKLAREELQTKMKELELFSEFDLSSRPKLPLTCGQNTDDNLGTIYVAEAHRIMGTFSHEVGSGMYASPVPSYEEMSVVTSVTTTNVLEEHKARMTELQLFTTETITSSLQNSFKRAVESMGLVRPPQEELGLFRGPVTTNEGNGQITRIDTGEDEEDDETVTSADPRFPGYISSCQLAIEDDDDGNESSSSTSEQRTLQSGNYTIVSIDDDDTSAGNASQSLYTVDEDDGSSEDDQSNGETTYSAESDGDDEDESVASGSTHSSDSTGSQSDYSSPEIVKTIETEHPKGFAGWIPGL